MDYKLNEIQKKIYSGVKNLADTVLNKEDDFSKMWKYCADFGILASMIPEKVGGLASNYSDILLTAKSIGELFTDSGFVFAINNSMIVASYLLPTFASEEILVEIMPGLIDGSSIASYAITEPQSGSDVYNMLTKITVEGDNIRIYGSKTYISNGPIANIFVIVGKDEEDSYTAALVKSTDFGVEIGGEIKKMGLEKCPMSEIYFNDCVIPKARIIGKFTQGQTICNMTLDWERCLSFSSHLGTMNRIMNLCINYANDRKQFGKTIGSYQLVSEKIARMKVNIELGELLLYKICDMKNNGKKTFLESAIFKYFIGESYANCGLDAMQVFGAYGYCEEGGIEKEVRDALGAKIYSGTSEIQLDIISRMIGIRK